MDRSALATPVPWRGEELLACADWHYHLGDADISELDGAVRGAAALSWDELSRETFPLPGLGGFLGRAGSELANGTGVVKISGVPVARYTDVELRRLFLGLSAHLGTPTVQNRADGLLRDICDRSAAGGRRVDSADALNWHNDRTDIVGLLCVREATAGGVSRIASVTAIHNAMLERCPDLLDVLFDDFMRHTPGDEVGGTQGCHPLPIFRMYGGRLSTHYSRTYIEQAAALPGATPLSAPQNAALDRLVGLAEELAFEMVLEAGEIQFLNNHSILHGRTAFTDDPGRGAGRLLLRVWLSTRGQTIWEA